jgi:hypothetical protein
VTGSPTTRRSAAGIAALLFLVTLLSALPGHAGQAKLRGQIVNRDGAPQAQCQVVFYRPAARGPDEVVLRVASDRQGYFVVETLRNGTYRVQVILGNRQAEFARVTRDDAGLHPTTLVVQW